MPELLGLVGMLVVFAGIHLLWQSRKELFFWLETYFRIFRASLQHPGSPVRPIVLENAMRERRHILRMILGMGLVFFLGPFLIVLGLTL